ncbi:nucleoside-diphosphate sugar epimerase [Solibacillus sp. MA9]|uniref:Nucleoside-diphosphate sugar epimerase n=1 Tax=Solibacillus palustris TaxID=2908203 RepID=A0ABS9UEA3_9BACL|nr:nucleoside-diphosphate sugar epimerase [Solibacillus sp. MA9]MCH7322667.1 nucleoside-diphosphate sugar epimerase [Solibacillus sp. MA9]
MLKIKKIEFMKVLYDDALAQNIFSIANITFSNYETINGALLYWQQNNSEEPYTKAGDYKFFYDLAKAQYFASVKFPKGCELTNEERQELAYILLEERGAIGTYSFLSTKPKVQIHIKKAFEAIPFPNDFDVAHFDSLSVIRALESNDEAVYEILPYDRAFINSYYNWLHLAAKQHYSKLLPYLGYIPFTYICYKNPLLSEQFLIEHLQAVNLEALQHNKSVLNRLTTSFKRFLIDELLKNKKHIHPDFVDQIDDFIESNIFYRSFDIVYLPESDEIPVMDLQYFEYDRGNYKWPGSEHLVKGIPSLKSQRYDRYGDKRLTNSEMDDKFTIMSKTQQKLFTAVSELHWINRYKNEIDWSYVCQYNEHLTEEFLMAHIKYIDFEALGQNTDIAVNTDFLEKYMHRFNHSKVVPLIIRHLTEDFYLSHKDQIQVNIDVLYKYIESIDLDEFARIESHLNN